MFEFEFEGQESSSPKKVICHIDVYFWIEWKGTEWVMTNFSKLFPFFLSFQVELIEIGPTKTRFHCVSIQTKREWNYLHVGLAFLPQFSYGQFRTSIAEEFRILRQEVIAIEPPNGRVNLLPRQIALQDHIQQQKIVISHFFIHYFHHSQPFLSNTNMTPMVT